MCAAIAFPESRRNVSVQRIDAFPFLSVTVAVNTPAALADAFGAGTSFFELSVARYEYVVVDAANATPTTSIAPPTTTIPTSLAIGTS
jgi:hypothetical protein